MQLIDLYAPVIALIALTPESPFKLHVKNCLREALSGESYSRKIESLLRLTESLRAGGHIQER